MTMLNRIIQQAPTAPMVRSADGRGALFWAEEFGFEEAISLLLELGADPSAVDASGKTPRQLGEENVELNKERTFPGNSPDPEDEPQQQQQFNPDGMMNEEEGDEYPTEEEL